ncbi:flagellin lysine-N-methylase [Wukongibacter sp. M2B1]|uniref:flagellin lysine-N-methylase n=1 Tax=Wukongibacter sp. M2B1 TaxID=3088895 RepID=UPI003D78B5B5
MNRNKKFKILQPKYYSKFNCDPDKCLESCCERWKIIVDKSTYERYIKSKNRIIQEIVRTGLSINKEAKGSNDFAIINLNKEMVCPFLNQNNLCEIFINMGEESLSKTCKSYPRAIVLVKDVIERGLEMSCSVAAELALLNDNGIKFEYIMDTIKFDDVYVVSPTIRDLKQVEIINEIRTTIIDLLQTRTIGLGERVAVIGLLLTKALENIDSSAIYYEEVLNKIKQVKALIEQGQLKAKEMRHKSENVKQFHHLNTILSMKFKEGDSISFFSKRYIECLMQVLDAFAKVKDKDLERNYKRNYEKYLRPYLYEKAYILENFLVNYVFVYSSEIFNINDIWTLYLKLCVIYGLLKFNLVGLATYNKEMNDDLMLKLIQSLSKTIIPDKKYMESVMKYLEQEKLNEYTNLITLILD